MVPGLVVLFISSFVVAGLVWRRAQKRGADVGDPFDLLTTLGAAKHKNKLTQGERLCLWLVPLVSFLLAVGLFETLYQVLPD